MGVSCGIFQEKERYQTAPFSKYLFSLNYEADMNPQKIGQFLDMLSNEYEDVMPAVEMFHYVLTIEAMYLQMMTAYFIQSEDMDGYIKQSKKFNDHINALIKKMTEILKLEMETETLNFGESIYYNISGFSQVKYIVNSNW